MAQRIPRSVATDGERGAPQPTMRWSARLLLVALAAAGCSSAPVEDGPAEPAIADGAATLCVHGREILRVAEPDCERAQAAERAAGTPVSPLLDRLTLEYAPDDFSLEILEGIIVGAGYKYRVEPSYRDSYFTRIDAYTFKTGASPGDLLGGLPLRIGFKRGAELMFAQQFASGPTARSPASTYGPQRVPLSAERARELKIGDYVRFRAQMGLVVNAGQVWPLAGFLLKAEAGLAVLLDGEYQVHVFRLDEDRVRIKLVAERAREVRGGAELSTSPFVKAALLNRVSNRLLPFSDLIDLDPTAALAASKSRSDLFLVDYTVDLADPEAAAAYDRIFLKGAKLAEIDIALPLRNEFELRNRLLGSIEEIDALARTGVGADNAAVVRHFKGSNYSATRALDFKVKFRTFNVDRARIYRENFLTRAEFGVSGVEELSHFLLPTWTHVRDRSMAFGMLDEDRRRSADALFLADSGGAPIRFLNIGFTFDYTDARLRPSEYRDLRRKIELLLPTDAETELASLMTDTTWLDDVYRRNVSLSLNYYFREGAFDGLVAAGYGDRAKLGAAMVDFIVGAIEAGEFPFFADDLTALVRRYSQSPPSADPATLRAQARRQVGRVWDREIATAARNLAEGFNAGNDPETRMRSILALRDNTFFQTIGPAFWVDLVQRAELDLSQSMFLTLRLTADEHQGIEFVFGEPGERQLYQSAKYIESLLNDRSLDMRELGDLETVVSRMKIVTN